jgi:hypothetical protein
MIRKRGGARAGAGRGAWARRKLTTKQRAEIAESVLGEEVSAAEVAGLYDVSQSPHRPLRQRPTLSSRGLVRVVAATVD